MVRKIDEHFSARPVRPLYHYTGHKNFRDIVVSGELWATQMQYVSDSMEFRYAAELVVNLVRESFQQRESDDFRKALIERTASMDGARTFIVCFSEEGDQLSQWRAYCAAGGVSIGFSADRLAQGLRENSGFKLVKCLYDREEQRALVRELLLFTFDNFESLSDKGEYARNFFLSKTYYPALMRLAPCIKHHSFYEEKEWRLVGGPFSYEDQRNGYRAATDMLIPYFKYSIGDPPPISSVRIGPSRLPNAARQAAHCFLRSRLPASEAHIPVNITDTSFRPDWA